MCHCTTSWLHGIFGRWCKCLLKGFSSAAMTYTVHTPEPGERIFHSSLIYLSFSIFRFNVLYCFHVLFTQRTFFLFRLICLLSVSLHWQHKTFHGEEHLHDKRLILAELSCLTVSTSRAALVTDYTLSLSVVCFLYSVFWEAMRDTSVWHASDSACVLDLTSAWRGPYKAIFCCQSLQWRIKFWQIVAKVEHELQKRDFASAMTQLLFRRSGHLSALTMKGRPLSTVATWTLRSHLLRQRSDSKSCKGSFGEQNCSIQDI